MVNLLISDRTLEKLLQHYNVRDAFIFSTEKRLYLGLYNDRHNPRILTVEADDIILSAGLYFWHSTFNEVIDTIAEVYEVLGYTDYNIERTAIMVEDVYKGYGLWIVLFRNRIY